MDPFQNKLLQLRGLIKEIGIDAYIIPSSDPHLGEYVPDHWRIIEWLTGFTGSSATVVVTETFAGLWTDSRYFIQGERQLSGTGYSLMKSVLPDRTDYIGWLRENIKEGGVIGLDSRTFSIGLLRRIEKLVASKKVLVKIDIDLISTLWTDRSPMEVSIAFDHPIKFCGRERTGKIDEIRKYMKDQEVDYHLLTSIDDIMWMLNIRGNDIKYSPLLTSFAIVGEDQILLFVDENKIPLKLASDFDKLDIVMLPYEEIGGMLSALPSDAKILLTPGTTSAYLYKSIPDGMIINEGISIPTRLKAVKNSVEIDNISHAMIIDGVALSRFFFWLEQNIGTVPMSELSLAKKLFDFRSQEDNFHGSSFETIVGWREHGALPHYNASSETDSVIGEEGILLIDSGAQYFNGTTDITRTISIGKPTMQQKKDFTLVLKGTINLALAKFPSGTKGYQLDVLARKALWENGLNYSHGTGHGVGFFLNVHEGPHNIGSGAVGDSISVIEPGMLFSDEPAIYREGEYGIRTENLILCFEDEETEFGKFLKFDTLSLCYIEKALIDISLLDEREISWLNSYHSEVYDKISPFLSEDESRWLKEKTSGL